MKNTKTTIILVTNKWTGTTKEIISSNQNAFACLNHYRKMQNVSKAIIK